MSERLATVFSLLMTVALMQSATAQIRGSRNTSAAESFLIAPRPFMRLLNEGKQALEQKRYSDGIQALGVLLQAESTADLPADLVGQDFFLEPMQSAFFRSSIKAEATRVLAELDAQGREVLELQYGVTARQALQQAIESQDWESIGDVARRFMHTEAGYDANVLLAEYQAAQGHARTAAGILQRLLRIPSARQRFGVELAVATATAWIQAGKQDAAIATLEQASKDFSGAQVRLAGRELTFTPETDWARIIASIAADDF